MDKEHVKGAMDKTSGEVKKAAGRVTGDKSLEAEGHVDKAKGAAREFIGDVKDAANKDTRDDMRKKH